MAEGSARANTSLEAASWSVQATSTLDSVRIRFSSSFFFSREELTTPIPAPPHKVCLPLSRSCGSPRRPLPSLRFNPSLHTAKGPRTCTVFPQGKRPTVAHRAALLSSPNAAPPPPGRPRTAGGREGGRCLSRSPVRAAPRHGPALPEHAPRLAAASASHHARWLRLPPAPGNSSAASPRLRPPLPQLLEPGTPFATPPWTPARPAAATPGTGLRRGTGDRGGGGRGRYLRP